LQGSKSNNENDVNSAADAKWKASSDKDIT